MFSAKPPTDPADVPVDPAATPNSPNLFALYDQSLAPAADMAQMYENPVVDNVADFSTHGTGQPYDFYDQFEGPLTGRGQPTNQDMRGPQVHEKMAQVLLAKMQEKQQTSAQFQQMAQQKNKEGAGPSGY